MIFFTKTKCKICFINVGFNCKRKKWGKKMSGYFAIKGGGVGRLMAKTILNFHFDYLTPSLSPQLAGPVDFFDEHLTDDKVGLTFVTIFHLNAISITLW